MKIGFIGAGNMATAILGGVLNKNLCQPADILVSRRQEEALKKLKETFGVGITTKNEEVVKWADILFLSVKPQMLSGVARQIKPWLNKNQLIVSVAAGKTLHWLEEELGGEKKLVRSMPNTPALVGEGCTAFCVNEWVVEEEIEAVNRIFSCCGTCYQVEEGLMDTVGAASGSSPAYVFMFMEAMADAAVAGGLPRAMAYKMVGQTVLGSARLMLETEEHPGVLKDQVCSPAGTTIWGLKVLEEKGMKSAVFGALEACMERAKKI